MTRLNLIGTFPDMATLAQQAQALAAKHGLIAKVTTFRRTTQNGYGFFLEGVDTPMAIMYPQSALDSRYDIYRGRGYKWRIETILLDAKKYGASHNFTTAEDALAFLNKLFYDKSLYRTTERGNPPKGVGAVKGGSNLLTAFTKKNQVHLNKAIYWGGKYNELVNMADAAEDLGDTKLCNKLHIQQADAFNKYLEHMNSLPKKEQSRVVKLLNL